MWKEGAVMKQSRDIRDDRHVKVKRRDVRYRGHILNLVTDELAFASTSSKMMYEYITHDSAAAVLPIQEGSGGPEILLIRQCHHPTRSALRKIPVGLVGKPRGEPIQAAQRELAEEIGMAAVEYEFLARFYTSPECSDGLLTIYLARGLTSVETNFARWDEETEVKTERWALSDVIAAIQEGALISSALVVGILAT